MGMLIGYKVVWTDTATRQLWSIMGSDGSVLYVPNQWTYPLERNGPLCVYDSLKQARLCRTAFGGTVYKCEYVPAAEGDDVWYYTANGRIHRTRVCHLPSGTVLATRVRLLNKEF